jgi:hypothetical protein
VDGVITASGHRNRRFDKLYSGPGEPAHVDDGLKLNAIHHLFIPVAVAALPLAQHELRGCDRIDRRADSLCHFF